MHSWLNSVMSGLISKPERGEMVTAVPETYGDLKRMIARSKGGDWPSRVNPSLTHSQALRVLRDGLADHPDDLRLDASVRGSLYARNVQRECTERA